MFFTRSQAATACRYVLISLHVALWIIAFPLALTASANLILLILFSCAGFALLVYIPTAVILSIKDSNSRFDRAGAEVAYVAVQIAAHFTIMVFAIILTIAADYDDLMLSYRNPDDAIYNKRLEAVAGMSILQIIIGGIWICWLTRLAHRTPRRTLNQAMKIPAHRLIHRDFDEEERMDMRRPPMSIEHGGVLGEDPPRLELATAQGNLDDSPPVYTESRKSTFKA